MDAIAPQKCSAGIGKQFERNEMTVDVLVALSQTTRHRETQALSG